MQEESETFKVFSYLYFKRIKALNKFCLNKIKLEKLGVSKPKTDAVKDSNNLGQSSCWWN